MGALIVLLIVWGVVISFFGYIVHNGTVLLIMLAIGWGPLALLLWWKSIKAGKGADRHAAALAESGIPQGQGLDHSEGGTGIAIDRPFKLLMLIGPGGHKSYPYADVRGWSARAEKAGYVRGNNIQATGAKIRMEMEAKNATGLFVTVRDIDQPEWRVAMKDAATRARWMEILQQEINEDGVAA